MAGTTSRKPTAERREQIALAALRRIGERGFAALTTASLAEAVGLSAGALFRHFDSREAILDEAVRLAEQRVEATFPDPAGAALDRLRQLACARIDLLTQEPGIAWLLRSAEALLSLPTGAVTRLRALVQRSRATVRAAIDEAVAAGDLRADVPADVLLLAYTSTVHALVGQPGLQGWGMGSSPAAPAIEGLLTLLSAPDAPRR